MTDKEFDELMQHNSGARINTGDGRLLTLEEFKQEQRTDNASAPTPLDFYAGQARRIAVSQRTKELLAEPHEDEMQAAVIAWADSQSHPALKWLFHVPNGGYRDPATAGRMKQAGQKPGVPDLLLPWTRFDADNREIHGLVIEMKRKPNRPTREQAAWLEHFTTEGWRCEVCYSAQAAIDVLREYLGL